MPGGGTLPASAVAGVAILPTHRRRGIMSRLADLEHAALRERGEAVAVLLSAEYPIYGRFGYGVATRDAAITVRATDTSLPGEPTGSFEMASLDTEACEAAKAVFDVARRRVAGEIWRRDASWEMDFGLRDAIFEPDRFRGFLALHRDHDGAVDGYARYAAEPRSDAAPGRVDVADLHALSDAAYADLWRLLLSIDLVGVVRAVHRPVGEPLPWLLTNARAAEIGRVNDRLWLRIFDLPRALEARAYEQAAALTVEVVDDERWGGTRRWRLEAGPDGASCRPTGGEPDLTLPIAALGAAYLGGTRLQDAVRLLGADEHRTGSLAQADALFRTADEPWCSTFF
jgi:predicted acetyltransferase